MLLLTLLLVLPTLFTWILYRNAPLLVLPTLFTWILYCNAPATLLLTLLNFYVTYVGRLDVPGSAAQAKANMGAPRLHWTVADGNTAVTLL
jgi:hypothetical protein